MQEIRYTVDSWSTWFSKLTIKPCFVVREHVNDDTIGLHTVDEGLDVGEVISTYETKALNNLLGYFYVAIATTHDPRNNGDFAGCIVYNKNVYGNMIFLFKVDYTSAQNLIDSENNILHFLSKTNTQTSGNLACITEMFIIPPDLIPQSSIEEKTYDTTYKVWILSSSVTADKQDFKLPIAHTTPTGYYEPINKKCYCFPYNYLYVTNNSGNDNIYKYEDFTYTVTEGGIEKIVFNIQGCIATGYSCKLVPEGYKNVSFNTSEELALGKFPVCRLVK